MHAAELLPLILALALALGFECVNGFHDTANAVATVIYTRSLPPWLAVIWSGICNFLGVLLSTGAVAFAIINLLPVDLVTNVGSPIGVSMIFSLLLSALLWNAGTWYLGIPVSSTHSMIGAIMGVGLMNSLLNSGDVMGVNWKQAENIGMSLLISPVVGFIGTALLFLLLKALVRRPDLYQSVEFNPPPWWIRGILCLTCTGVSYAHGSNDGQKGLGLMMLILAAMMPGIYAVNPAGLHGGSAAQLSAASHNAAAIIQQHTAGATVDASTASTTLINYLKTDGVFSDKVFPALAEKNQEISNTLAQHKSLSELPDNERIALRGEIFLASGTIAKLDTMKNFPADQEPVMMKYKTALDKTIKFIPSWVKMIVALALGAGTMVGWKRVVVTVGEKIGKAHLTYGQGACAEMIAMLTVGLASRYGLPVSTTHVLSSGVAGSMAANRSGLQQATLRNIILAWVLTLPACIFLGAMFFAAAFMLIFHVFHVH